jgi:hypothetical protein
MKETIMLLDNQDEEEEKPYSGPKILLDYIQLRYGDYPTLTGLFDHIKLIKKYVLIFEKLNNF